MDEIMKNNRRVGQVGEPERERERASENVHKNGNTVQLQCPSVQTKIQ